MSASKTVRFAAEFDDTELIRGLNSSKTAFNQAFANQPGIQALEQEIAGLQTELGQLEQSTSALEQGFSGLNSASTGIGGTFQEIGDAANQAGDNFNTLGTAGATVEQQLAEIGTTSTTMGQSLQALGTDIDTTGTSMGALASNFTETTGTSDTLMQSLADSTTQFKGLGKEAEGTGSTLKDMFSKGGGIAVGISATISGIANLVRGFRDYDDAQVRVRKGQRLLSLAQEAAGKAQDKYNAAVAEFGINSKEAAAAQLDVTQALSKVQNQTDSLAIQTKRAGDAQQDIWLGVAGTVTGIGGSIMQVLTGIGGEKGLAGLVPKVKGLAGAFTGVSGAGMSMAGALATIAAPLALVTGGIALAIYLLNQDSKTMTEFAAAGIKLTSAQDDMVRSFSEWEKIQKVTHMSMAQMIADPAAAAKAYIDMGGKVDSSGKIVLTTTEDIANDTKSGFHIVGEAVQKATGIYDLFNPAVSHAGEGVDGLGKTVKNSISPVMRYKEVWDEATGTTKLIPNGLKDTYTAINGVTTAINDSTTDVIKNNGMWIDFGNILHKIPPPIDQTSKSLKAVTGSVDATDAELAAMNKSIGGSANIYQEWINKGVDPANQIIKELSTSVKSGVIPQDQLGIAVELTANKLEAAGVVTEGNKQQVIQLATAYLKTKIPVDQLAAAIEKAKNTVSVATPVMKFFSDKVVELEPGVQAAVDELSNFNEQSKINAVSTNTLHDRLVAQVEGLHLVADASGLTTAQMKLMIDANNGNRDAIAELNKQHTDWATKVQEVADKYNTELNPALVDTPEKLDAITKALEEHAKAMEESKQAVEGAAQAFSSMLDATKVKDFNKALKEMNLDEALGKPFEKAVKRLGPGFVNLKINLDNAKLGLEGLLTFGAKVDFTTFSNGLDTWVDSLENLAASDPDTSTEKMDNLFQSIRQMTPEQLQQHAGSLTSLVTAMMSGKNISAKEVAAFFTQFDNEEINAIGTAATNVGALGTAAGTVGGPLGKAGTAAGTLGTNLNTIQPPDLNPFAEALNTVILAMADLSRRVSATKFVLSAPDIHFATDAFKSVEVNWRGYANKIQSIIPKITVNNSQALAAINAVVNAQGKIKNILQVIKGDNRDALNKINQVVNAQGKIKNITQTITTVYRTVGSPAHAHNIVGAHTNTRLGGGETTTAVPLIGGGGSMTNTIMGGGTGDVNITIINRDEFGTEKIRKFKAVLGKDRYVFGASGSGG